MYHQLEIGTIINQNLKKKIVCTISPKMRLLSMNIKKTECWKVKTDEKLTIA